MRAILRQLSSTQPDQPIKEPVAKEYESRKRKADEDYSKIRKLTLNDCTRLILALTNHSPATIIIDALDECDEFLRHELLEALDKIVSKSSEVVKVFVSSRDDVDIISLFPPFAHASRKWREMVSNKPKFCASVGTSTTAVEEYFHQC